MAYNNKPGPYAHSEWRCRHTGSRQTGSRQTESRQTGSKQTGSRQTASRQKSSAQANALFAVDVHCSMERPFADVLKGDWFRTKSSTRTWDGKARPQCIEYLSPPGDNIYAAPIDYLPVSTYFGPVHDRQIGDDFVSVYVPSYWLPGDLVWINVSRGVVKFAERVPREELDKWRSQGWQDWRLSSPIDCCSSPSGTSWTWTRQQE